MSISDSRGFLLDTNVISEATRLRPDANVVAWLAAANEDRLFLSVATLAELNRGIEAMAAGKKQRRLREWLLNELMPRFEDRILPVDPAVSLLWGAMSVRSKTTGRDIGAVDALLAATAERHGLTIVTRNVADFAGLKVPLLDPWQPPSS
jgi:toxin FitB